MFVQNDYKNNYTFEERRRESQHILDKYIDRVPVIVEFEKNFRYDTSDFKNFKYMFPDDLTLGQALAIFRKKIKLDHSKSIYIFVNSRLVPSTMTLKEIYIEEKNEDGMLYFVVGAENTFG